MAKKWSSMAFVAVILAILLAGLGKTLFFPEELNAYENRYAEQVDHLTAAGFADGSFQESVDAALSDQVHFSQTCKNLYNTARSAFRESLLVPISRAVPNRYLAFSGNLNLFGGNYLLYSPYSLSDVTQQLTAAAESHNRMVASHPQVDFYFYYIGKEVDANFETGSQLLAYEYLAQQLAVPADHVDDFPIHDFATYRDLFYRTDHHWNHVGSYAGYLELLELLDVAEAPLTPVDTITVGQFSGSKALQAGAETFSEPFDAYRFDFPTFQITMNGKAAEDYGAQGADFTNTELSYGAFYGGDAGEVILDSGTTGRGSILIIGESHDNAILKLLASHFDCTYAVDLRNYTHYMGNPFDLDRYLTQHNIDKVLFIGSIGFYTSETFRLGG